MIPYHRGYPSSSRSLGKVQSKTHKTALVILPPKNVARPIQAIRKKHDRQFYRWMPHINLLYPFKPKSDFDSVLGWLVEVCSRIDPFDITLSSFQYFRHGKKGFTIWLGAEPRDTVVSLQEKLWKVVPECDDLQKFSSGFTPHLSVGQTSGQEKTRKLMARLQASWKPLTFRVSEVCLIWRRDPPDDQFRIGERIRLFIQ
ncbi:MAG: 2'-5' RNA ligase family protein [Proteobacteria bacterium]|nr:2'-5' RNA ligase family protein [Pseudomonadota bacterium]